MKSEPGDTNPSKSPTLHGTRLTFHHLTPIFQHKSTISYLKSPMSHQKNPTFHYFMNPILQTPPKWQKCESFRGNGLRSRRQERAMDRMDQPRTSIDERMLSGRRAGMIV